MRRWRGHIEYFLVLYGFWLLLSWRLDPIFFVLGAVSAAAVAALTHDLLTREAGWFRIPIRKVPLVVVRVIAFTAWLLTRIVLANFQVAFLVLHPRLPLDPAMVRFPVALSSPLSRTVFAHSITLVPGTLTVEIEGGECVVHVLFPSAAADLVNGKLQHKVASMFLEPVEPPGTVVWEPPLQRTS